MSANKFRPHLYVLPEDDANTQVVNGFLLGIAQLRNIHVLPAAGGWGSACELFLTEHVKAMRQYERRYFLMVIDFDGDEIKRATKVLDLVPLDIRDRFFLLGTKTEPEALRQAGLGSYETIGKYLADECRNGNHHIWSHDLLVHNAAELARIRTSVYKVVF